MVQPDSRRGTMSGMKAVLPSADRVLVGKATHSDVGALLEIERESYPPDMQADEDKLRERLDVFPEGQLLLWVGKEPVGYATNQVLRFDPAAPAKTWLQCTNGGYIANTHESGGNALYFVSTGVRGRWRSRGLGSMLYDSRLELAQALGLEYAFANFRIQTLRQNLGRFFGLSERAYLQRSEGDLQTIGHRYLELIEAGEVRDPLCILFRRGFRVLGIRPWYMADVESLHLGVVMYRGNRQERGVCRSDLSP